MVAGDEMRRARADAARIERGVRGGNQRRIGGQTEVVVAAEGNDVLAVDRDVHALRTVEHRAPPFEMIGLQRRQPLLQAAQRGEAHNGVSPSASNRRWSRSHSGLPVVSSLSP